MSDITQAQLVTNIMRVRMEAAVETLLALLDEMDGNPDLEDGADDEPYLSTGTVAWGTQPQSEVDAEGDVAEVDYPGSIAGGQGA